MRTDGQARRRSGDGARSGMAPAVGGHSGGGLRYPAAGDSLPWTYAGASDRVFDLMYAEMRRLAGAAMGAQSGRHTLQATALVHEAFIRLVDHPSPQQWDSSRHFFSAAAESMRRILIEHARKKKSIKRGQDPIHTTFDEKGLADEVTDLIIVIRAKITDFGYLRDT